MRHGALPSLADQPLPVLVVVFVLASGLVWIAGRRLAGDTDALAERTGLRRGFLGLLVLGFVTSLPEIATTVTASVGGNADLAVNNLFGGVALQLVVLALADLVVSPRPLTARVFDADVILQGVLLVAVLAIAATIIVMDDVAIGGIIGLGTLVLFAFYCGSLLFLKRSGASKAWRAQPRRPPPTGAAAAAGDDAERAEPGSPWPLVARIAGAGVIILVAGATIAIAGEGIADATGLGSSFVGAVFVAFATSIPEVSTTIAAVRLGSPEMAFGNIFGTNILEVALLFLVDLAFPGPPVLNAVGAFSVVAALIGILVTTIWLAGLLERRPHAVARMGVDAIVVTIAYAAGLVVLYGLR